jgi:hypothetical protein
MVIAGLGFTQRMKEETDEPRNGADGGPTVSSESEPVLVRRIT